MSNNIQIPLEIQSKLYCKLVNNYIIFFPHEKDQNFVDAFFRLCLLLKKCSISICVCVNVILLPLKNKLYCKVLCITWTNLYPFNGNSSFIHKSYSNREKQRHYYTDRIEQRQASEDLLSS